MVDNDEFRRNVPKGFQPAARAVFNRLEPDRAVRLALNAASAAFKERGCPGLDEIAHVVAGPAPVGSGDRATDAARLLDAIARDHLDDRTTRAVRAAKALLGERTASTSASWTDRGEEIARRFIVDFIGATMFTPGLAAATVQAGRETLASYHGRRRGFLDELGRSDGLTKLAAELCADPHGGQVRQQRAKRREPDPRADIDLPLTAD